MAKLFGTCMGVPTLAQLSLLLASCTCLLLPFTRNDLAQHDHAVAIHESDTRQAFAILEGVTHEGLLWLEGALGHLVRFQRVWLFHFLSTSFLAHLPCKLRDAASRAAAGTKPMGEYPTLISLGM